MLIYCLLNIWILVQWPDRAWPSMAVLALRGKAAGRGLLSPYRREESGQRRKPQRWSAAHLILGVIEATGQLPSLLRLQILLLWTILCAAFLWSSELGEVICLQVVACLRLGQEGQSHEAWETVWRVGVLRFPLHLEKQLILGGQRTEHWSLL